LKTFLHHRLPSKPFTYGLERDVCMYTTVPDGPVKSILKRDDVSADVEWLTGIRPSFGHCRGYFSVILDIVGKPSAPPMARLPSDDDVILLSSALAYWYVFASGLQFRSLYQK
jgi:hypothetical protein